MRSLLALVAPLALGACGTEPALQRGAELYASPGLSGVSTAYACATCHSPATTADPAHLLPGFPLGPASARPSYWGGQYRLLLDAVSECDQAFLGSPRPLDPADPDGRALLVYLESLSTVAAAPALPLTVVANVDAIYLGKLVGGDATRGLEVYARGCAGCHGALHAGAGHLGPAPLLPEAALAHGTDAATGARAITVEKVRHGGYFGVGGVMPPYAIEALSDAQLADLLAGLGL